MILRKQRLFAIVLLISLGLNLFLGGLIVGKHLGHSDYPFSHSHDFHRPLKLRWLIESLPADSQEKVRPLIQAHRQLIKPQFRRIRQARQVVHQQLTAPEMNAEALSEVLAKLSQERAKAQKMMHATLVTIAGQLNAEERHHLSEATRKRRHSPWKRNRDREPNPESQEGEP